MYAPTKLGSTSECYELLIIWCCWVMKLENAGYAAFYLLKYLFVLQSSRPVWLILPSAAAVGWKGRIARFSFACPGVWIEHTSSYLSFLYIFIIETNKICEEVKNPWLLVWKKERKKEVGKLRVPNLLTLACLSNKTVKHE